jgi:hypothetical protein
MTPSPDTPDAAESLIRHEEHFRERSEVLLDRARRLAEDIQRRVARVAGADPSDTPSPTL